MIGARTEITGTLTVVTALHIGTGGTRSSEAKGDAPDTVEAARIATVQRDADHRPCLPGSSIKGVLSDLLGRPSPLFGHAPSDTDADDADAQGAAGQAGTAIFWTARLADPPGQPDRIRTERRTAIDPTSGVAAKARLFQADFVEPGTRFVLRITLGDQAEASSEHLALLLRALTSAEGVAFGRNVRQGHGRLTFDTGTLAATHHCPIRGSSDVTADWQKRVEDATAPADGGQVFERLLVCEGPFAILDHEASEAREARSDAAQLAALSEGQAPALTGSTLAGALRARFAKFVAIHGSDATDNRDKVFETIKDLGPVERLFGVTGWKGRVAIVAIRGEGKPKCKQITSVRLDRFSGAPIDNALFTTKVWVGAQFRVTLRLDAPRFEDPVFADDAALFEAFLVELADPVWGGLDLGHGSNKGLGWFRVEEVS